MKRYTLYSDLLKHHSILNNEFKIVVPENKITNGGGTVEGKQLDTELHIAWSRPGVLLMLLLAVPIKTVQRIADQETCC